MSDKIIENNKKEYGVIQNIYYLMKNMWKWERGLFIWSALQVPITVIIPLVGIYLPKVLIDSVTGKESVGEF